jgi:glycosyltransferase involved in cell wall biosynthesis
LKLRQWDYIASKRHDITLANSATTAKRLKKYFRLDAEILYPPIETQRFSKKITQKFPLPTQIPYYITLSALTEFKRIDIAIKAFKQTPEIPLLIIGDGEHKKQLETLAGGASNIFFV